MEFIYQARPARVIFGAGSLRHLEDEVQALGAQRALVLCTPEQRAMAESVAERLGARAVGVYDRAAMHVPIEVARDAREFALARRGLRRRRGRRLHGRAGQGDRAGKQPAHPGHPDHLCGQ